MLAQLITILAVAACGAVLGAPMSSADTPAAACTSPTRRISWHDMAADDKKAYLDAAVCLIKSPAKLGKLPGAKTRWDELTALHQIHSLQIHSTGTFLPFHRYFLKVHQTLLAECGYDSTAAAAASARPLPYWDEPRDAGTFSTSPVFDTALGLGGSGRGVGNCVQDGPFANLTVNIGPGFTSQSRCINRRITNGLSAQCGATQVKAAIAPETYNLVWNAIYSGPHLLGHMALGMMDGNSITSSGDPLFMLHHGFVDKMWWDWQMQKPETRLTEMGGPNTQDPAIGFSEFPGGIEEESRMWGKPTAEMLAVTPDPRNGDGGGNVTTLDHVLSSIGIIPDARIRDVMDVRAEYLCWAYP